jgi:hypothetical protein
VRENSLDCHLKTCLKDKINSLKIEGVYIGNLRYGCSSYIINLKE